MSIFVYVFGYSWNSPYAISSGIIMIPKKSISSGIIMIPEKSIGSGLNSTAARKR